MRLRIFAFLFCLTATLSFAEEKQPGLWDYSVKIGLNLGGTMPFPTPANIEEIKKYSPNFSPAIEAEALRWFSKKIGVSAAISSDNKGLKNTSKVKRYSMKFGNYNGEFTGDVETKMNFNYLKLPILAHYAFESFSVYAGVYYAYLLSGEFKGAAIEGNLNNIDSNSPPSYIEREEYDFSKELRNNDAGFSLGLNFLPYNEHILLSFDFNYGLVSVFHDDFEGMAYDMQNIYGKLSVGYLF